jgi:hypothetical protein
MRQTVLASVFIAALAAGGHASAQSVIEITPDQERTIYTTVTKETIRTAPPADMQFSVGTVVPPAVELYPFGATVAVPAIRPYHYTVWGDRVVLVEPGTRKVVRIIERR